MTKMNESDPDRGVCEAAERGKFPEFAFRMLRQDICEGHASQSKSSGCSGKHHKWLIISLFFLGLSHGCGSGDPEAVADRFMDRYYVAADLGETLKVADGLAGKKIRDQQQLTRGESGPQTTKGRRVSYTRIERTTVDGKLFLRYEVRIDVQGGGSLTRKVLLAMAQEPNEWRVTNFTESD